SAPDSDTAARQRATSASAAFECSGNLRTPRSVLPWVSRDVHVPPRGHRVAGIAPPIMERTRRPCPYRPAAAVSRETSPALGRVLLGQLARAGIPLPGVLVALLEAVRR